MTDRDTVLDRVEALVIASGGTVVGDNGYKRWFDLPSAFYGCRLVVGVWPEGALIDMIRHIFNGYDTGNDWIDRYVIPFAEGFYSVGYTGTVLELPTEHVVPVLSAWLPREVQWCYMEHVHKREELLPPVHQREHWPPQRPSSAAHPTE